MMRDKRRLRDWVYWWRVAWIVWRHGDPQHEVNSWSAIEHLAPYTSVQARFARRMWRQAIAAERAPDLPSNRAGLTLALALSAMMLIGASVWRIQSVPLRIGVQVVALLVANLWVRYRLDDPLNRRRK